MPTSIVRQLNQVSQNTLRCKCEARESGESLETFIPKFSVTTPQNKWNFSVFMNGQVLVSNKNSLATYLMNGIQVLAYDVSQKGANNRELFAFTAAFLWQRQVEVSRA